MTCESRAALKSFRFEHSDNPFVSRIRALRLDPETEVLEVHLVGDLASLCKQDQLKDTHEGVAVRYRYDQVINGA